MPAGPVKRIDVRAPIAAGPLPTGMPGRAPTGATAPGGGAWARPPLPGAPVWTTPAPFLAPAGMAALAVTTPPASFLPPAVVTALSFAAAGLAVVTGTGSPQGPWAPATSRGRVTPPNWP